MLPHTMNRRSLASAIVLLASLLPATTHAGPSVSSPAPVWRTFASPHPTPLFYAAGGVAVGGHGNIFLADWGAHRVEKLSPSGQLLVTWGTDVPGPLRFAGPQSIALDPSGDVYLADRGIVKLGPSGRVVARWT